MKPPAKAPQDLGAAAARAILVLAAVTLGAILILRLAEVLLLIFGAVLAAVLFHAIAKPLRARRLLSGSLALGLAVLFVLAAAGLVVWLFGYAAQSQFEGLSDLLPRAWAGLNERLSASVIGRYFLEGLSGLRRPQGQLLATWAPRFASGAASAAAAVVIIFFAGAFLAFHPKTYFGGALMLAPRRVRPRLEAVGEACGEALRRWLLAQLASMLLVGISVTLGLWIAGVPSPLALGALAGLGQFVPIVGPIAAAVPGLLVALSEGLRTFAWASLVYLLVSQLEANFLTPLVMRQFVAVPMAVTLFAVFAMGVLFGTLGVLFATPLTVVAYVAIRMLYVEDVLGEKLKP